MLHLIVMWVRYLCVIIEETPKKVIHAITNYQKNTTFDVFVQGNTKLKLIIFRYI